MKTSAIKWSCYAGTALIIGALFFASMGTGKALEGFPALMRPDRIMQIITWRLDDRLDAIHATDDQRSAMYDLKDKLFKDAGAMRAKIRANRAEIVKEWQKDLPDADRINELIDTNMELRTDFAHKLAEAILKAHDILTPKQRKQIVEHINKRMSKFNSALNEE